MELWKDSWSSSCSQYSSLYHYAVNLSGGNLSWIYAYAVVEWANDMKLDVFAVQNKTNI